MPVSSFIAFGVIKQIHGIATKKAVYELFEVSSHCSYKTFVVNLNRFGKEASELLACILQYNQQNSHWLKFTDTTDIPVCLSKNARTNRIFKSIAEWGHSGKGFYYGLKLHLTCDFHRQILKFSITPADANDRDQFRKMNQDLLGYFIADAGYISKKLEEDFVIEGKRRILIRPTKRMKKLAAILEHLLYRTRMRIESIFQNLKISHGLVTSLPRSLSAYFSHYLYSMLAYLVS